MKPDEPAIDPKPGDDPRPIEYAELRERLGEPGLVLVDVLPAQVYRRGHLPTAVSLPLEEIEARAAEVLDDPTDELVIYCRNEH